MRTPPFATSRRKRNSTHGPGDRPRRGRVPESSHGSMCERMTGRRHRDTGICALARSGPATSPSFRTRGPSPPWMGVGLRPLCPATLHAWIKGTVRPGPAWPAETVQRRAAAAQPCRAVPRRSAPRFFQAAGLALRPVSLPPFPPPLSLHRGCRAMPSAHSPPLAAAVPFRAISRVGPAPR